ncbi:hypothetical protein [Schlesneria paludicola]|uniref:hypothetical protein n=1 Tax=Schlesneria paludicola TaxID=360056 RepID=UPI00029A095C|nr:hypothetical protein [Schlesneria paludicola]
MNLAVPPRDRAVNRTVNLLKQRGSPYLQMIFFLLIAGVMAFLTSVCLHALGMTSTAFRYPISVGVAYATFLLMMCSFVSYHRRRRVKSYSPAANVIDADFGHCATAIPSIDHPHAVTSSNGAEAAGSFWIGDADAAGPVVLVVLLVIAVGVATFASFMFVIQAPALLAEVLVDGVLLVGLTRSVEQKSDGAWLFRLVRKTILPAIAVAASFALLGMFIDVYLPGATTLNQALNQIPSSKSIR